MCSKRSNDKEKACQKRATEIIARTIRAEEEGNSEELR